MIQAAGEEEKELAQEMAQAFLREILPEDKFGAPKAGPGMWASQIRVMNPSTVSKISPLLLPGLLTGLAYMWQIVILHRVRPQRKSAWSRMLPLWVWRCVDLQLIPTSGFWSLASHKTCNWIRDRSSLEKFILTDSVMMAHGWNWYIR